MKALILLLSGVLLGISSLCYAEPFCKKIPDTKNIADIISILGEPTTKDVVARKNYQWDVPDNSFAITVQQDRIIRRTLVGDCATPPSKACEAYHNKSNESLEALQAFFNKAPDFTSQVEITEYAWKSEEGQLFLKERNGTIESRVCIGLKP